MSEYILGFSVPAFAAWVLLRVPNIINSMIPPKHNLLSKNFSNKKWMNILRRIFQILCIFLLIFVLDKEYGNNISVNSALILALLFFIIYLICWIHYLQDRATPFGLIFGITLMQPLYILSIGLCLHNRLVTVPCLLYAAVSVWIAAENYWPRKK